MTRNTDQGSFMQRTLNPFLTSETLFFGDGVINGTYPNFTPSFAAAWGLLESPKVLTPTTKQPRENRENIIPVHGGNSQTRQSIY